MKDSYLTIAAPSTGVYRDRGSKFLAYAYPIDSEAEALENVEALRREHPQARHWCYAYRLGLRGDRYRANDDGEPSGTAGRPILGQIDNRELTNIAVVVVRYFGGVKLGVGGLIQAYKASAAEAVSQAIIVERFVEEIYRLEFAYDRLGAVLAAVERMGLPLIEQTFGDGASLTIALRQSVAPTLLSELRARIAGVSLDEARAIDELPGIAIHHRGLR
jgi:uncharacterized YigZ family protein